MTGTYDSLAVDRDRAPRDHLQSSVEAVLEQAGRIIVGKPRELRLAMACLFAGGHLLIEDQPGVGKTTLAHALAALLGLGFRRIQFTSDLLPADLTGINIYRQDLNEFEFRPGPLFAEVVVADEVNRATPRTQSALLEAMEENQVTVDGVTYALPVPFFVLATQNPLHEAGTFPLPASQLDRFQMRLRLGYPESAAERALLEGRDRRALLNDIESMCDGPLVTAIQAAVAEVRVSAPLLDYVQDLLAASRLAGRFRIGLSPRAGLDLVAGARSWAFLNGRGYVVPEDIQAIWGATVGHRLQAFDGSRSVESAVNGILDEVAVP